MVLKFINLALLSSLIPIVFADLAANSSSTLEDIPYVSFTSDLSMGSTSSQSEVFKNLPVRPFTQSVVAKELSEGNGATVRRTIGHPELRQRFHDPFLLMDDFTVAKPAGFPDHPHRGFGTITYIYPTSKGTLLHEDFTGAAGKIEAGGVQIMNAGKGIVHAEMPMSEVPVEGLQLWLNSPKQQKLIVPSYQEFQQSDIPKIQNGCATARIIAGQAFNVRSQAKTWVPVDYIHFEMEPFCELSHSIPSTWNALTYIMSGSLKLQTSASTSNGTPWKETEKNSVIIFKDALRKQQGEQNIMEFDASRDEKVVFQTNSSPSSFVFVAGQPIGEQVIQYGPFVMNAQAEIRQAFQDYQQGRNGFESARNWSSTIGRG